MNCQKAKSAKLGLINSILLVAVFVLPILAACMHLQNLFQEMLLQTEAKQIAAARFELNRFYDELDPRVFIEKALQRMEKELDLVPDSKFLPTQVSRLYGRDTTKKIRQFLAQNYHLQPIFIALPTKNGREFHSYFSPDFFQIQAKEKFDMVRIVSGTMMKKLMRSWAHHIPEVKGCLSRIKLSGQNLFDVDREAISGLLAQFFAPAMHFPENPGVCEQVFTTRFSSNKIYVYFNGSFKNPDFHGGFFILFAARDIPVREILRQALTSTGNFTRSMVLSETNLNEKLISDSKGLSSFRAPGTSIITRKLIEEICGSFAEKRNLFLKVSSSRSDFLGALSKDFNLVRMCKKLAILGFFFLLIYSMIHGIRPIGLLRSRFLMLVGLVVLIPYAITGYLAGITLDQLNKMRRQSCLEEAEAGLYEINRLIADYSLRRQLVTLSEKQRIAGDLKRRYSGRSKEKLSAEINSPILLDELYLFEKSGQVTTFRHKGNVVKEPYKLIKFMGYSYLENLGILESTDAKVKRELELAKFASGFLSSLRRDNVEGQLLRHEGAEVKNLAKLEQLSRMIFFVYPEFFLDDAPIIALSFIFFNDLETFGRLFDYLEVPTRKFFADTNASVNYSFAIGRRSGENSLEKFWPQSLTKNEVPRRLLEFMVSRGFSGYEIREENETTQARVWQFNPDSEYVTAGVVNLQPERLLKFMFYLLPLAGIIFSALSLLFLADLIWEIFARPIKDFIPAFAQIEQGNYATSVVIESGDELELLADSVNEMTRSLKQREKMRRFIPQKVFQDMLKDQQNQGRKIEKRKLTLLASDIRGFTSLGEKHAPEEIVSALNDYFTLMEEAIIDNEGEIERFIGDAIIAVFYENAVKSSAQRAFEAGLAMREKLRLLNLKRQEQRKFLFENGIGILTDDAWVVTTGASSGRRVHMVFGDVVDRANELEALTAGIIGNKIAVCEKTAAAVSGWKFAVVNKELSAFSPASSGNCHE